MPRGLEKAALDVTPAGTAVERKETQRVGSLGKTGQEAVIVVIFQTEHAVRLLDGTRLRIAEKYA